MSNAQLSEVFLSATDGQVKGQVLGAIAAHYGISVDEAWDEVIGEGAEHLLDYLSGTLRSAVSALMQRQTMTPRPLGSAASAH